MEAPLEAAVPAVSAVPEGVASEGAALEASEAVPGAAALADAADFQYDSPPRERILLGEFLLDIPFPASA